jgi:hypothetical protein
MEIRPPDPENPAPLSAQGRCPFCRYRISIVEEGEVVIKAAIIKAFLNEGKVCAKCPKCKHWLIVPLQYLPEAGEVNEINS